MFVNFYRQLINEITYMFFSAQKIKDITWKSYSEFLQYGLLYRKIHMYMNSHYKVVFIKILLNDGS